MDENKVKNLKVYLEALEKARSVEKEARMRLLKEALPSDEQTKWAGILKEASSTVNELEKGLETALKNVQPKSNK
jgi:hypothetical protein